MIFISHRGNIYGPNFQLENTERYIEKARKKYFVEIDVWKIKDSWWLGHDAPEQETSQGFISQKGLLLHAKNLEAFKTMLDLELHCFWHQDDDVVLTSCGFIWTSPGKQLTSKSIVVLPELNNGNNITMLPKNILGICSDFIVNYNIVNKGVEE